MSENENEQLPISLNPPPGTVPVVLMVFGSHLYGTNSPTSDRDYKGVFLPDPADVLLNRVPKSVHVTTKPSNLEQKNTAADAEVEWYSLPYFLHLALEGQTVAIDMLHARAQHWLVHSPLWSLLFQRRHAFYTKNLKAFVGYARRQAAKYGVKGSRLSTARDVLAVMEQAYAANENAKMSDCFATIARLSLEHVQLTEEYIETCGKKMQNNARVVMYLDTMRRFVSNYGERARQAESNEGIDWKAMSHALRAGYEVRAMLRDGDFSFPLPQTEFLMKVKSGVLDYRLVAETLESVMDECEQVAATSGLPEKPDFKRWERWLLLQMHGHMKSTMDSVLKVGDLEARTV